MAATEIALDQDRKGVNPDGRSEQKKKEVHPPPRVEDIGSQKDGDGAAPHGRQIIDRQENWQKEKQEDFGGEYHFDSSPLSCAGSKVDSGKRRESWLVVDCFSRKAKFARLP